MKEQVALCDVATSWANKATQRAKILAACAFPLVQTKDFSQKGCHGYSILQSVKDAEP